jgi:hypothetical protein
MISAISRSGAGTGGTFFTRKQLRSDARKPPFAPPAAAKPAPIGDAARDRAALHERRKSWNCFRPISATLLQAAQPGGAASGPGNNIQPCTLITDGYGVALAGKPAPHPTARHATEAGQYQSG